MRPIAFPEQTKVLQKPAGMTDEECAPLPVFNDGKQSISCWRPSWRERLSILVFGRVWCSVLGGQTQPPIWLMGARSCFEKQRKEP